MLPVLMLLVVVSTEFILTIIGAVLRHLALIWPVKMHRMWSVNILKPVMVGLRAFILKMITRQIITLVVTSMIFMFTIQAVKVYILAAPLVGMCRRLSIAW